MSEEKKDVWDKFRIVTGILIPIAIAYAGHVFAIMQHKTEMQTQENQFEHQYQISVTNAKVSQIGLVVSFFDALLSNSPKKKKLAIKSILIAMPNEGPELVKIVSELDEEEDLKDFATRTLDDKRKQLIEGLFDKDKTTRLLSYQEILSGWKNDPKMAQDIASFGNKNLSNQNGVYNALAVLSNLNKTALSENTDSIVAFSKKAELNGSKTQERALLLRERIPSNLESME